VIKVEFQGGKELAAALATLPERVSKRMQREALIDAAEPIRLRMEQLAPRGSGPIHLADRMVISNSRGQDSLEIAIAIGPAKGPTFYGGLVELGTAHAAAQPFARPAFDEKSPSVLKAFAEAVWLALTARGVRQATTISDQPVSGPGRLV
jgi:HK97 gp10 family phage protein